MIKIYAITLKNAHGPYGEGAEPYLALATDGKNFELGNPLPLYTSYDKAEEKRLQIDPYDFRKVTELKLDKK